MTKDQEIYQEIGKILLLISPNNAKEIIMNVDLVSEDDVCEFKYKYIDEKKESRWITGGGINNSKIHDLLVELRQFFLSQNQPYWKGCEFKVDLETGKIEVKFIYD